MTDAALPAPRPRSALARVFVGDDGLRAGWSLLLFFILLVGAMTAVAFIPHTPLRPNSGAGVRPLPSITAEGTMLIVLLVVSLIMSLIERRRFACYGLGGAAPVGDFLKGLFWGFVMLSVLIGLLALTGGIAIGGLAIGGGAIVSYGISWAVAFVLVGLFEEFSMRGYLQFTLARGVAGFTRWIGKPRHADTIGFWVAAFVFSILLFALLHTGNGGETPMGIIAVALAGLLFVFALWWTGSLWWAIGFHAAWDWAQSYFYGVADSGLVSQGHLLASHPTGTALISGGTTGPEGSILVVPVLLASLAVIWRTMPRRKPAELDRDT